jgi:uncharacterized membrane protein
MCQAQPAKGVTAVQYIQFPKPFEHAHPPIRDVNEIEIERLTSSQRAADRVAAIVGSWWFIGTQSVVLLGWASLNVTAAVHHWDPYPFILMNLFLSLQAAYTAPVLMMSQNRLAARDRLEAHNDYEINRKAEEEVRAVLDHLSAQDQALTRIVEALASRLHALPPAGGPPGNTSPV